jgi:hypothetical protein
MSTIDTSDDRPPEPRPQRPYRSLFWPVVLIALGLLWLLSDLGVITQANLGLLLRLWPLILIVIGLDILFGRSHPAVGGLIALVTVVVIVGVVIFGPALGIVGPAQPTLFGLPVIFGSGTNQAVRTDHYSEPIGPATSAQVNLHLSSGRTQLSALSDSTNLIDADITHVSDIQFTVTGSQRKTVTLGEAPGIHVGIFGLGQPQPWNIKLTPNIPLDLEVDGGSGSSNLDASALKLTSVQLNTGSGSVDATLPKGQAPYRASIDTGSGHCSIDILAGADVDLDMNTGSGGINLTFGDGVQARATIDSGSGGINVQVPSGAALRVQVASAGSGGASLPRGLTKVSGAASDREGIWETPGYANAKNQISIVYNGGSGGLRVR